MIPRHLHIFHATAFEEWGPWTPDERGIGNSETAQIEIGKAFAKRGWRVSSYAPLPAGREGMYDGVDWANVAAARSNAPGYWLIFREPERLDAFQLDHPDQKIALVSQDESYRGRWNDERVAKLDILFALCGAHQESLRSDHAGLYEKAMLSSNGIKMDLIREIDKEPIERNPHRAMFASSPDRGLEQALKLWPRVREVVEDAELHCFYGLNNMRKLAEAGPQFAHFGKTADRIEKLCQQPGVVWHGRVGQPDILREWRKSAILISPTLFRETSFVSQQEAQAMGAIPIVSPQWAAYENLCAGIYVQGNPDDPLTQARFVGEIWRLMVNTQVQEAMRGQMMLDARLRFNWERQADKYEAALLGFADHPGLTHCQFNFQVKHCLGANTILNVGCADDPANLKAIGAVNMDAREEDPIFHRKTAADIVADVREIGESLQLGACFERVVCGDMLEHFPPEEVPAILRKLKSCLAPGGKLVLTIPDDRRPLEGQHAGASGAEMYSAGVCASHDHPIPLEMVHEWMYAAGLSIAEYQEMDCHHYKNHGILAEDADTPSGSLNEIDRILAEAKA